MIYGVSTLATNLHLSGRMRDRLREILSQHGRLSVPVEQVGDRSDLYQAGLTSLATVGLMLAIEDAFDIEFPDALLSRNTFRSIDALAVAIERLQVKA
jgi:acyl carrier protein